jgi:nucleoside 2-deoxyribosyltransferase
MKKIEETADQVSHALYQRGMAHIDKLDFDAAMVDFEDAMKLTPNDHVEQGLAIAEGVAVIIEVHATGEHHQRIAHKRNGVVRTGDMAVGRTVRTGRSAGTERRAHGTADAGSAFMDVRIGESAGVEE